MNQVNCITIHAPLHKIFLAASDLTRWPEFLPHYRHNRFLSQTPSGGVVKMSSIHAGIPLSGIQEFRIDPERRELRFTHLRSTLNATRGLEAIWTFEEQADGGVEVTITHHMAMSWPFFGRFLANKLVGTSLIRRIANKTLTGLKRKVEAQQQTETSAALEKEARSPKSSPAAKPKTRRQPAPATPKKAAEKKTTAPKPSKKPTPAHAIAVKVPAKKSTIAKVAPKPAPKKAASAAKVVAKLTPAKVSSTEKKAAKPASAKTKPAAKPAAKPKSARKKK